VSYKDLGFCGYAIPHNSQAIAKWFKRHNLRIWNSEGLFCARKVYLLRGYSDEPGIYVDPFGSIDRAALKSADVIVYSLHDSYTYTTRRANVLPTRPVFKVINPLECPDDLLVLLEVEPQAPVNVPLRLKQDGLLCS